MQNMSFIALLSAISLGLAACASGPVASADAAPAASVESAAATPAAAEPVRVAQATQSASGRDAIGFDAWVADFRRQARRRGVDRATLQSAFAEAVFEPRIIELDRRQPEFSRAIWDYLDSAVSDTRVRQGREQLATHADIARRVENRYGVPRSIIGAIWGVESNYGANFGSYETIDALATLGYDGRRGAFAERELYAALEILASGDIDRDRMQGSWAGAMGHPQFLPSSYLAYAVDEDGDGRRDIWASIADVMGSTANYLNEHGWEAGEPWGREVVLPPDFDYARAELDTRRAPRVWRAAGVRPVDTRGLPSLESASIIAPAGAQGPAFMVGTNFRTILRYNNATSYALAVGLLSDRLAGRPGVRGHWPRDLESLSRRDITTLQRQLNALGYSVGRPDGLVGPNTRAGLRAFQRDRGLAADGYPTMDLLERISREIAD